MSSISRRSFVAGGAAAAGAVAAGVQLAAGGVAGAAGKQAKGEEAAGVEHASPVWLGTPEESEPMVIFVRDAARGEVAIVHGEQEIVFKDPALVARVQRRVRRGIS
jgi:hypothetical protein